MHAFWTIPTANMTYTRLHNYTNMVGGEHGIHTFEVVVVVLLSFDVFVPKNAHPLLFLDKWFVQIYLNVSSIHEHQKLKVLDGMVPSS